MRSTELIGLIVPVALGMVKAADAKAANEQREPKAFALVNRNGSIKNTKLFIAHYRNYENGNASIDRKYV